MTVLLWACFRFDRLCGCEDALDVSFPSPFRRVWRPVLVLSASLSGFTDPKDSPFDRPADKDSEPAPSDDNVDAFGLRE